MEISHLEIFNRPQAIENSSAGSASPNRYVTENIRWVPLITRRLMEDGCLIGGHLSQ